MKLAELTKKDIGRAVIFKARHNIIEEEGVITSYNDSYIFVRYGDKTGSQATYARDLEFLIT